MLHGAAKAQAPMEDSKLRTPGCGGRQRSRRRVRHEQGSKAPEHGTIVSRSKLGRQCWGQHAKQVQGPGGRAVQQQQPGDLEVWEGWEPLKEDAVLRRGRVELRSDVVICTEGVPGLLLSPTHARASPVMGGRSEGRASAKFQTRVLASWRRMCASSCVSR